MDADTLDKVCALIASRRKRLIQQPNLDGLQRLGADIVLRQLEKDLAVSSAELRRIARLSRKRSARAARAS